MEENEILQINIPENLDALSVLAFEDEPEGTIIISLSASYLYKLALKAYPEFNSFQGESLIAH